MTLLRGKIPLLAIHFNDFDDIDIKLKLFLGDIA